MLDVETSGESSQVSLPSAARLLPETWSVEVDDHVLDLRWSSDGACLAALPSLGSIGIFDRESRRIANLAGHPGGNGSISWDPKRNRLASFGQDSVVRIHEAPFAAPARELPLEKGWAERVAWSPDGKLLAACVGRHVHILNVETGALRECFSDHKSTICDLAWNPSNPTEIATVCDGGARTWRLGQTKPIGHFDWGGASLLVTWSGDGRWVVTGDQTPSVHLYDTRRRHPLHIQGYQTKVKALAWEGHGKWLASGGGPAITIWPCSGKKGPEGAKPIQLFGHLKDVVALEFAKDQGVLASGGRDGLVLIWMPHRSDAPALVAQRSEEITVVRWSPQGDALAFATSTGRITLCSLKARPQ
jgi:hypothetical protein